MGDRLSDLPDEIRLHIISLLPSTSEQARTSVLSKRWLHLWTHSPALAFHLRDFSPAPWVDPIHTKRYPLIVDRCLELSTSPTISTLSFEIPPCRDPAVDRWLDFAAFRSARELSLRFFSRVYSPPLSLFHCRSLAVLRLECCDLRLPPSSLCSFDSFPVFPSLKSLSLIKVAVASKTLHTLLSSSPLLETLVLDDCSGLTRIPIPNPRLQSLVVRDSSRVLRVFVSSLHLRSIFFQGHAPFLYLRRSPSLLRACILGEGSLDFKNRFMLMLFTMPHVEILLVDSWFYQSFLHDEGVHLRGGRTAMFQNVKELHFRFIPHEAVLPALGFILQECPSLEKLCIEFKGNHLPALEAEDRPPEVYKGFKSTLQLLKTIRFFNICDSKYAKCILAFLLGNAVALDTLVIHPCSEASAEWLSDLREQVSLLPRACPLAIEVVTEQSVSGDTKLCHTKMWEDEWKF